MSEAFARLKRERHPMPEFVRQALEHQRLLEVYRARPGYQQNDYLGWINRGRLPETQQRRLEQVLDELTRGDVYMNMAWRPARRSGQAG